MKILLHPLTEMTDTEALSLGVVTADARLNPLSVWYRLDAIRAETEGRPDEIIAMCVLEADTGAGSHYRAVWEDDDVNDAYDHAREKQVIVSYG